MNDPEIETYLRSYLGDRDPNARYSSFDYCFNWFQEHREGGIVPALADPRRLQWSCLQLGFYLASWGMYRGGAELLRRSAKALEPTVQAIVEAPPAVWELDVDAYGSDAIALLLDVGRSFRRALPGRSSDTLVTKAMLGVFGCVPAYDRFFRAGFGASTFGPKSLRRLASFAQQHDEVIERYRVPTVDFRSGQPSERRYTKAKVLDMIFFMKGGGGPAVALEP